MACGEPRPPEDARAAFAPKPEPPPTKPPRPLLAVASWAYLAASLIVLALEKGLGDRWWPATVLMFAPRWIGLAPWPILVVPAVRRKRWRLAVVPMVAAAVVAGPLMGLRLPVASLFARAPKGDSIRVLTLNRGGEPLDSARLVAFLVDQEIDVICFQEGRRDALLDDFLSSWASDPAGKVFSRLPMVQSLAPVDVDFETYGEWGVRVTRMAVKAPSGRVILVASAHMPTMSQGFPYLLRGQFSAFRRYRDWRSRQVEELKGVLRQSPGLPVLLSGDFNMPPDSPMMKALRRDYASGFEAVGWGYGYTRPATVPWIGIDRILAGPEFRFVSCRVGPSFGSDHRSMIAEVVLTR